MRPVLVKKEAFLHFYRQKAGADLNPDPSVHTIEMIEMITRETIVRENGLRLKCILIKTPTRDPDHAQETDAIIIIIITTNIRETRTVEAEVDLQHILIIAIIIIVNIISHQAKGQEKFQNHRMIETRIARDQEEADRENCMSAEEVDCFVIK